jgi:hypothetical protein
MKTLLTTASYYRNASITMTEMLFYHKNDFSQQEKADWQTRRIAITLLTISMSFELRRAV